MNTNTNVISSGLRKGIKTDIHGFTLTEVSRGTGISKTHVCHIFSGKRSISLRLAAKLSAFLGIQLETLHLELEHAAQIARRTGVPIAQVAQSLIK